MYYISVDIGTNSVGWCVIDENGKLVKFKRKNMWGVRLFSSAQTAAKCRLNRSARRRYFRRKTRIMILREFLAPMINEIDPNFYLRLDEAFLWKNDKSIQSDYIYFNDPEYTDKEFYKEFPTIYHVRKHLLATKEKVDARLIYMALHHIIKYRGHFLYEGEKLETVESVQYSFFNFVEQLNNCFETVYMYDEQAFKKIENVLKESKTRKLKKDEVIDILVKTNWDKKIAKEIANAILGYSFDLAVLFNDEELQGSDGKALKTVFDEKYEEKKTELQEKINDKIYVLDILQQIYGWAVLQKILNGNKYLSESMIDKYEKHHRELAILKSLFKKYATAEEYSNFFLREVKSGDKYISNYANYIAGTRRCGETSLKARENLYKEIKRILDKKAKADDEYQMILSAMEEDDFLIKLNDVCNSYIPYQLNEIELVRIIEQQGRHYPEIKENADKIAQIFRFRIPYYVGPLNAYKGARDFSWMNKIKGKEKEKIYPWNFEEVVDLDSTAERFITRMTGYCTYLPDKKVLPKHSLLYEKYELLQELNKISIDGKRITKKDRDEIIKNLFEKQKGVNDKQFRQYLYMKHQYANAHNADEIVVEGYQKEKEFASSLSSYVTFKKIFGKIDSSNEAMIEEIIYWLTVFEEKSIVKRKIADNYGDRITEKELKQILELRFTGWGRFSREFLNGIKGNKGETIIEMLVNEEDERYKGLPNLMQIISMDEEISEQLKDNRKKYDGSEELLDVVLDLPTSPAIKRGIWQSMKIINEIIEVMNGEEPQQIFIEFARGEEEKERKESRKRKIEKLLKKLKDEIVEEYNEKILDELKHEKYHKRLDEEKVYLYFLQNGKCLYSGNELDIESLPDYEVDHIIPQSLTDDDSLDNKALVIKRDNQDKGNCLVMECYGERIKKKNINSFWKHLYQIGMLTEKKYSNLRKESIYDVMTRGFINRQLVETRQIVKAVANLIRDYYQERIDVVEVKAALNNSVRKKYTYERKDDNGFFVGGITEPVMYKNREINDMHHAHDAYLAAVIGMYLQKVYPKTKGDLIYSEYRKEYKMYREKLKKKNTSNFIFYRFDKKVYGSEGIIWDGEDIISYMKKIFGYRDMLVSHKVEENTGTFYKETIQPKPDGKERKLLPLKKDLDVNKYGGYTGVEDAYFVLVRYKYKKKNKMEFLGIPICDVKRVEKNNVALQAYLEDKLGVKSLEILRNKVPKYQLIQDERGDEYYLVGAKEVINAKQLVFGGENQRFNRIIAHLVSGKWEYLRRAELNEELNAIFNFLNKKIAKEYSGFVTVMDKILATEAFEGLELQQKVGFVIELLKLTKANAEYPSLKKIGVEGLVDRMGRKNSFTIKEKITIIDMSVTGMYERRICFELEDNSNKESCQD